MAIVNSVRNLFIPHKDKGTPDYHRDMTHIEEWSRQPIQQLIAGTGVSLTPASGLATDQTGNGPNPITISSTGSGPSMGAFIFSAGPDSLADNTSQNGGTFLSAFGSGFWPDANITVLVKGVPTFNQMRIGGGWVVAIQSGVHASVNLLPILSAPTFTGGPIVVNLIMGAASVNVQTNQTQWSFGPHNLTSGATYNTTSADWSSDYQNGTDLVMTAGVPGTDTGNGLVSQATAAITYAAGVWGTVDFSAVTAFT